MAQYLPSSDRIDDAEVTEAQPVVPTAGQSMADLKIFWGPEICRLEYLVHLLDTGRIKEEHLQQTA